MLSEQVGGGDVVEVVRGDAEAQRARVRAAYRAAGPQAVAGFRQVLEAMMDRDTLRQFQALRDLPEDRR